MGIFLPAYICTRKGDFLVPSATTFPKYGPGYTILSPRATLASWRQLSQQFSDKDNEKNGVLNRYTPFDFFDFSFN